MPKPIEIMATAAALMNDAAQEEYTNIVLLPYFNLALSTLQELYEHNDIPATNSESTILNIPVGVKDIGFDTNPALPADLIEIKQLWESERGRNSWTPVTKRDFLAVHDGQASRFMVYAWIKNRIRVVPANVPIDLKLDYICSIFNIITTNSMAVNMPFTNIKTYLEYKTGALAAMFIAENEQRALALNGEAGDALSRALGIPIKGMQSIVTRRRPFRAAFKRRSHI